MVESDTLLTWPEILDAFVKLKTVFNLPATANIKPNVRANAATSMQHYEMVSLVPLHWCHTVLAHEFAHLVVYYWYERKARHNAVLEPHGVEWLTIYMILLNRLSGLDHKILIKTADDYKLRFDRLTVAKFSVDYYGYIPNGEQHDNSAIGQAV